MGDAGSDDDDPEFFKNVYAQSYSRPVTASAPQRPLDRKRESPEGSTSPEKVDPNELPRDFSARGAKLWEEKAKASERNWKKRREDELTCKLCGEKGHFAQVQYEYRTLPPLQHSKSVLRTVWPQPSEHEPWPHSSTSLPQSSKTPTFYIAIFPHLSNLA